MNEVSGWKVQVIESMLVMMMVGVSSGGGDGSRVRRIWAELALWEMENQSPAITLFENYLRLPKQVQKTRWKVVLA
jgi:hypothetical protein